VFQDSHLPADGQDITDLLLISRMLIISAHNRNGVFNLRGSYVASSEMRVFTAPHLSSPLFPEGGQWPGSKRMLGKDYWYLFSCGFECDNEYRCPHTFCTRLVDIGAPERREVGPGRVSPAASGTVAVTVYPEARLGESAAYLPLSTTHAGWPP